MAHPAGTDIGFQGGQVLSLRVDEEAYDALIAALADDGAGRWHTVTSDEEQVQVNLSEIVYVRRATNAQKVGF